MPIPEWFDPDHYAGEKVKQMNDIQYLGRSDWERESYKAELVAWRDSAGNPLGTGSVDDLAFINFKACNGVNYDPSVARQNLNVSPNEYFDVYVYLENLAKYATKTQMEGAPLEGWTANSMLAHLYNDLHISAWEHYTTVGMFAGINPSNAFDTDAYLAARVEAMNTRTVNDTLIGWEGRTNWKVSEIKELMQKSGINPIMDMYTDGAKNFNLTAVAPPADEQVAEPENWNAWITPPPFNPYEQVEQTVEMTAAQNSYTGQSGVNTRFEAVWDNVTADATIATTDTINAGANAYNTLAVELNASWPGFRGQAGANVANVGRLELSHGTANASTPYTFDARNISELERVDLEDNGTGAISLKNLPGSIKLVNVYGLSPNENNITEGTSIEYAPGVVAGVNDSLELGVTNTGTNSAPAPISVAGIENLAINALAGENCLNLHSATGVRNLTINGGGNIKITNVANGITNYDASQASGNVNMAASDLRPNTPVKGGMGDTTLTLTQDFNGMPTGWSNIDQLAINPLVGAKINGSQIHGLSSLWVNTAKDVALESLASTNNFTVYQDYSGSDAAIKVDGDIQNLEFSTSGYAAAANGRALPKFSSNVQQNATIHANGQGTLAGTFEFANAAGDVNLAVAQEATFGTSSIAAPNARNFNLDVAGKLVAGSKFNVADKNAGSDHEIVVKLENGIEHAANNALGKMILDSDGATTLDFSTKGDAGLAGKDSSLGALREFNLTLNGNDITFDCQSLTLPQLRNLNVNAAGNNVQMGDLGSASLGNNMEIVVNGASAYSMGKIQTGSNANVITNITADGDIRINDINTSPSASSIQGDIHLDCTTSENIGTTSGKIATLKGADIFMDFAEVQGNAFAATGVSLSAAESINYTGAQGADRVVISHVGTKGPSNFNFGSGSDSLYINGNAVTPGQRVNINVDLGADEDADFLTINNQGAGVRLGVFVENFAEGEDVLNGFRASSLTATTARTLLSNFGITDTAIASSQIRDFGSGDGVVYEGDLYAFNSNGTAMVMLAGITGNVNNLGGAPLPDIGENDAPDAGV